MAKPACEPDDTRYPDHMEKSLPAVPPPSYAENIPPTTSKIPDKNHGLSNSRPSAIPIFRKHQQMNGEAGMTSGRNFAAKAARAGAAGLNIVSSARPPWKGASGRTAMMSPIKDSNHDQEPQSARGRLSDEQSGTRYLTYRNGKISPVEPNQRDRSPSPTFSEMDQEELKPPVPLKTRKTSLTSRTVSPASSAPSMTLTENLPLREIDRLSLSNEIQRHMDSPMYTQKANSSQSNKLFDTSAPVSRFSWTTRATGSEVPSTPRTHRHSLETWTSSPPKASSEHPQPASRFSWTTRGTDEHEREAPSLSHVLDFGTPPSTSGVAQRQENIPSSRFSWTTQDSHGTFRTAAQSEAVDDQMTAARSPSPPPSIMSRRRPIPGSNASVHTVKRKPVPSDADLPSSSGPGKQLPLVPPELESVDIITALEAQLEEIGNRRINLQRLINSLKDLQPQNPVVQDLTRRRQDRRKLESLERELAEVRSKEHQVGLRLHRAWKRRDQEAPTGLWIRRVTG